MIVLAKVVVMVQIIKGIDLCICHDSNDVDDMKVAVVLVVKIVVVMLVILISVHNV